MVDGRAMSLPRTEDARLWSDDQDASRKSTAARDDSARLRRAWSSRRNPPRELLFRAAAAPRLGDSSAVVAREGCLIGRGETPRDGCGEGVLPRDRSADSSGEYMVDSPEDCSGRPVVSSSSSVNDTRRRGRERTVEVDLRLVFVLVPGLKASANAVLELIPGGQQGENRIDRRRGRWRQLS